MTANAPTRLAQLRAASLAMLDGLSGDELIAQSHVELSPMLWHVGHVFFVETYWIAERVFGDTTITEPWRDLYFPEICPKQNRGARLPDAAALRDWADRVSASNDAYWQRASTHPLLADGYLAAFVRQHYAQHLETMRHAQAQLCNTRRDGATTASALTARAPVTTRVRVDAQSVTLGTPGIEAYDNEQPPCTVDVAAFELSTHCVSNDEWLGFIEAGGYDDTRFWDDAGWQWRATHAVEHPQHWRALDSRRWHVPSDDDDLPVGCQPVHGIGWYEARAFARYAGARLPREVEWETAARGNRLANAYQVWEWCDDAFYPYPGFRAFPYDGYSMPWFDSAHFIARGGSRHTEPDIRRPGFRNFYPPTHRHVFAGLRLAW
ncbi:SUMF1/EgtB/PvdO family nonheme iron enzyme [Salinisphaera aquimarina]|uniref:SUMF1/EgtB/PvdO family nonheme iron enzyme n=1 Tax=Salinisphaera aquimarina TaxID=2094031 RepID=A0ABV7ET00_9GAMM